MSPDETILCEDNYTRFLLREVSTGKHIGNQMEVQGAIESLVFSPDGHHLALTVYKGYTQLFDVRTMEVIWVSDRWRGKTNRATSFTPDGRHLAVGGEDTRILLHDVESGAVVKEFSHRDWVIDCAFSPDGKYMIASQSEDVLSWWDVKTGSLLHSMPHKGWVLGYTREESFFTVQIDQFGANLCQFPWESHMPIGTWDLPSSKGHYPPVVHPTDSLVALPTSTGADIATFGQNPSLISF
jgi:WD40 repeat protein